MLCPRCSVRVSNIGNKRAKQLPVKGRVEIFRPKPVGQALAGGRKIRPDLDRAAKEHNGEGFDEQSCSSGLAVR